ncbi:hypothetical protein [Paraclostridium tenue]|uniref:Membrane protein n=1 Tax=Paraclostridium tenue TaxID=1737 RepID=A0ABN1M3K5_9FIRM
MSFSKKEVLKYLNITTNILILIYTISLIYFILYGETFQITPCFCSLIITSFIKIISKNFLNIISPALIFAILVFVFIASYLGSSFDFYGIVNHYDDIMHFLSGILVTLFGYDLFKMLNPKNLDIYKNRKLTISFVFFFNLAIAGLWEIFEFLIDQFFLTNMQIGGLNDTMIDMIDALLASIILILSYEFFIKKLNK